MTLWDTLTPSERHAVKMNMRDNGGDFAGRLAEAWVYADSTNERRIAMAFPDLVEKFQPCNWRHHA